MRHHRKVTIQGGLRQQLVINMFVHIVVQNRSVL